MDSSCTFDTENLYYPIVGEALYSTQKVKEDIKRMPYSEGTKKLFYKIVGQAEKDGKNLYGREIMDIIQCSPVWSGFREYNDKSNAWSKDCIRKLSDSHIPAVSVYKGMISVAESGLCPVYVYRNYAGEIIAVATVFVE